MKDRSRYQYDKWLLPLFGGLIFLFTTGATWEKLPALHFEECIEVTRIVERNPFLPFSNVLIAITAYQEKGAEEEADKNRERMVGKALNLYHLVGLLVIDDSPAAIPYHSSLIVSSVDIQADSETVERWVLVDENNDGHLDKATFNKTLKSAGGGTIESNEVSIPENQVAEMQGFYDKATHDLSERHDSGPGSLCAAT
jgi:hypothetical protein